MCNFWQWNLLGDWTQNQIQPMEEDLDQPSEVYLWGVHWLAWTQTFKLTTTPLRHHCSRALLPNPLRVPSHPGTCPLPQFCAEAIKRVTFPGHVPCARPSPAITALRGAQITAAVAGPKGTEPSGSQKLLLSGATPGTSPLAVAASPAAVWRHRPPATAGIASSAGTEGPWCCGDTCWAGRNITEGLWICASTRPRSTRGLWRIMLLTRVTRMSATSVIHVNSKLA